MDAIDAGFSRLDRLKIRSRVSLYLEMQSRPSELGLGQSQDPRLWVFYLPIFGIERPENDGYNPQNPKTLQSYDSCTMGQSSLPS